MAKLLWMAEIWMGERILLGDSYGWLYGILVWLGTVDLELMEKRSHWSHDFKPGVPYFPWNPGYFIGILMMIYEMIPHLTG